MGNDQRKRPTIWLLFLPAAFFLVKDIIATVVVLSYEPGISAAAVLRYAYTLLPGTLFVVTGYAPLVNLMYRGQASETVKAGKPLTWTISLTMIIMTALEFLGTFGVGGDDISHICHLGGMLIGYVYLRRGSFLYNVRNSVSDWKMERNKKRFQVYMNKHKEEPPSRPDRWVN